MFGIMRKVKREVRDRTVYMEVSYRVIAGILDIFGDDVITYGIEAEDYQAGEKEVIPDFSRNIEDAVDFTEMLITERVRPKQIYGKALNYLRISI